MAKSPCCPHQQPRTRGTKNQIEIESRYTELIALGRIGQPEEAAEAVIWLCSDAASYVTGHSMIVDDGENSLNPAHPRGVFRAVLNSLRIRWSGVKRTVPGFRDSTNKFAGDFLETSATIEVTATTPPETGHGFKFVSDAPETTETLFAQIGRERNGVFFS